MTKVSKRANIKFTGLSRAIAPINVRIRIIGKDGADPHDDRGAIVPFAPRGNIF
jgi:hypothetical protein